MSVAVLHEIGTRYVPQKLHSTPSERTASMNSLKPAVCWLTSYWDDQDVLFFFEADEDGWGLRQVALRGRDRDSNWIFAPRFLDVFRHHCHEVRG